MRTCKLGATVAALSVGFLVGRACAAATIRALRLRLADVEYQLVHDPLTSLLNRAGLIGHYAATAGRMRWLILVDINGFKAVNDSHGHHVGDVLLRAFGGHLRAVADTHGGVAGRIGGDEFVLLLPYVAHQPDGGGWLRCVERWQDRGRLEQ